MRYPRGVLKVGSMSTIIPFFIVMKAICRWGDKYVKMLFITAIKYVANGSIKLFLAPKGRKFKLKYGDNCLSMYSFSQEIDDSCEQSLYTTMLYQKYFYRLVQNFL
jgi:hypothetical protein